MTETAAAGPVIAEQRSPSAYFAEGPDATCRELGVKPIKFVEWRAWAIAGTQVGLQWRGVDHTGGFIHEINAKVDDQATQTELLHRKIETLEDCGPPQPRRPSK